MLDLRPRQPHRRPVRLAPLYQTCQMTRRMLVRIATFHDLPDEGRWVTQACGTRLRTDGEQATGICRTCAQGWNHPENYRADGPRPAVEEPEWPNA